MKKKLISIALGLVFAAMPTIIYAACSDVITFGNQICANTGSGTTSTGVQVCYYECTTVKTDQPAPAQPNTD